MPGPSDEELKFRKVVAAARPAAFAVETAHVLVAFGSQSVKSGMRVSQLLIAVDAYSSSVSETMRETAIKTGRAPAAESAKVAASSACSRACAKFWVI